MSDSLDTSVLQCMHPRAYAHVQSKSPSLPSLVTAVLQSMQPRACAHVQPDTQYPGHALPGSLNACRQVVIFLNVTFEN
eukprot:1153766-Pelagomonas_calceolata.AAC.8